MQIEELMDFLEWVDTEIRSPNIVQKYAGLHEILNRNAQPNQQQQPLEPLRDTLINAVLSVDLSTLNDAQTRFAEHIGLLELVGPNAESTIEDLLYRNVIDVATSAQKINALQTELNKILSQLQKVSQGLDPYFEAAPAEYDEALVHIRFQRDASIRNIVDLRTWGNHWYEIGRGLALANNTAPEEIRIIGASRGSLIYDLAVGYAIAHTLAQVVLKVLEVADRALEIRKKAEEIRGLKLSNKKAENELERQANAIEESGQAKVLATLKKEKKLDGEQETALSNAIKRMFEFVSSGGEIDIYVDDQDSSEDEEQSGNDGAVIKEIRQSFSEIKRIETKIALLKGNNESE